jgi:hypothetical protein
MRKDIKAINEAFQKVINEGRGTLRPGGFIDQLKSIIDTPDEKLTDVTNVSIRLSDQREIFDRYPKIYPYVKEMFTAVMSDNGAAKTKEIAKQAIAAVQKFYPNADKYQRANPKFSEDAEDIKITPADPNASWNPRDWNDNEPSDNKSMTIGEQDKHDKAFYAFWENIVDRLSDDVLESTMYMIKEFDALNDLIKEEYEYRNSMAQEQ